MSTKLKEYFPILWEKEELLETLRSNPTLSVTFDKWTPQQQEEFINFCTGVRGIKFLYDGFSKEILNPEYTPERLNDFLSLLMKQKVRIHTILPNDSTRIADESTLLITDLVVELENGTLANVEIQKIGYNFPGQRSACYSSDLLLRQYKRIRGVKNKKFSYKDIKDVYTIVLYEHSPAEFHTFPDIYLHYFEQQSDSGLELPLLQKFLFVPLDIFLKIQQNRNINNKLDAWLLFFASDDPEDVIRLIEEYPEFWAMYEQAYQICRNMEDVMGLFSEELRILDRNTVQYMIDEMQETIDAQKASLEEKDSLLEEKDSLLEEKDSLLEERNALLSDQKHLIEEMQRRIAELENK